MEISKSDMNKGLTKEEVKQRIAAKLVNNENLVPSKTYKQIILTNFFTLFNMLNLFLGVIISFTKQFKNLTFLGVVFCNTIISMTQEIRSKRVVDKLTLISKEKVNVVRDSKDEFINVNEIVKDDIVKYKLGNQVVVDSVILDGLVEVDESILTGESNYILKRVGDKLLSGSFIVSGKCITKVECIKEDSYANKITKEAKYIKKINSEIMLTLNKIIKIISMTIVPLGIILFLHQMNLTNNVNNAITSTVAALIGTIPEGLILLTSTVLEVSAIRLANKKVLVQELYCIENLARVDVICLDKTGTLTSGNMKVVKTINLDNKYDLNKIMNNISYYMDDGNSTSNCINNYFKSNNEKKLVNKINFSSEKKYSAYEFINGTYIVGAVDFIDYIGTINGLKELSSNYRVLFVGFTTNKIIDNNIKGPFHQVGLILIEDEIRIGCKDTLEYIKKQNVDIKIISGDNVNTINKIASRVGIENINIIDMTTIKDDEIKDIIEKYNIFGRVNPNQKKKIVLALKEKGHKVAMTGDGVNDVLSLKEADCSIAMSSGSDAARNVSQIVLLNSDFKEIPSIIKEGRRAINNLERSASLFLTKTIYAFLLVLLFTFIDVKYPFIPIQLTLISVLTIGIPSFILALEPNHNRVKGHFFINILSKSLPAAITIVCNVISIIIISSIFSFSNVYMSTMSVILVAFTGFVLLFKICYPFNYVRGILFTTLLTVFICCFITFNKFFELVYPTSYQFIFITILCILDIIIFNLIYEICNKMLKKYEKRILK